VTIDAARSASNTLGFDNWYVWTYRIDVIASDTEGRALSNWVLELPNCYVTSKDLFNEIEASVGFGGGDTPRVYDPELADPDPNSTLYGLKWDFTSGAGSDELDGVGEYDFFWFSAPTNIDVGTDWAIKAGNSILASGQTRGPECPGCPEPYIPEPASLVLMGAGIVGLILRNKRKG